MSSSPSSLWPLVDRISLVLVTSVLSSWLGKEQALTPLHCTQRKFRITQGHQWPSVSPRVSPVHAFPSSINSSCVPLTPLHCTHNTGRYGATVASVPVSPGAAKGQGLELIPLVCSVPRTRIYLLLLLDSVLVVEQIQQEEAWGVGWGGTQANFPSGGPDGGAGGAAGRGRVS